MHVGWLLINPSLPWLGAPPDGLVEDPSEKCVGLLEIKCPFTYHFSRPALIQTFFATVANDQVTLKQNY